MAGTMILDVGAAPYPASRRKNEERGAGAPL